LTRSTLEQALPDLLEKTRVRGWRAVVQMGDAARAEELSAHLWTYRKDGFLPHGTAKDGQAALQPIWITAQEECPNEAEVLFLIDGVHHQELERFDLVCELFDGNDSACVETARLRWADHKKAGYNLTYWQQGEKGWTKKGE
jgi:DNA polymerase-3 subunit chi